MSGCINQRTARFVLDSFNNVIILQEQGYVVERVALALADPLSRDCPMADQCRNVG